VKKRDIFRRGIFLACFLVWAGLIVAGTRTLLIYESTPGAAGNIALKWPAKSRIVPGHNRYTLVMLAHPNCPCTRASIAELDVLMAQVQGKLDAFVLFSKPGAKPDEMRSSANWQKAAGIPGVAVRSDETGFETEQFGGLISGETVVYDPAGHLVFSGGITASRGHEGDNNGVDAVVLAVTGKLKTRTRVPVFGCALHNPNTKELSDESWKKQ
jgi:hypothetical protein